VTVIMGTLSVRFSEPLITRFGARNLVVAGLALIVAALVVFAQAPVGGSYLNVLPVMVLMGTGAGLAFPALMGLAMSGATQEDAGLASGLINTTAQVGGALGLAVLATLSSSHAGAHPTPESLTTGYHIAFYVAAALSAAAIAVALTVLTQPKQAATPAGEPALSHA
jgi:MFS family permease